MLVMVVDPDVETCQLVRHLLENMGHGILECQNGAEALKFLAKSNEVLPDLVLLATGLPLLPGLDVARRLHADARWSHIPIILTATMTTGQLLEEAREFGVVEILLKPFNIATFQQCIDSALRGCPHK